MIVIVRMIVPASTRNLRRPRHVTSRDVAPDRQAVGRQLQHQGQAGPVKHRAPQHGGGAEGRGHRERVHREQDDGARAQQAEDARVAREDHGRHQRVDGQPGAAGDHRQRQHRDQPVPAALDRARRHDGGDRAGEAREHRNERLPVQTDPAHHPVDDEGDAGQVTEDLEDRDEEEQHRDLRHEDDPVPDAGDHAVDHQVRERALREERGDPRLQRRRRPTRWRR